MFKENIWLHYLFYYLISEEKFSLFIFIICYLKKSFQIYIYRDEWACILIKETEEKRKNTGVECVVIIL